MYFDRICVTRNSPFQSIQLSGTLYSHRVGQPSRSGNFPSPPKNPVPISSHALSSLPLLQPPATTNPRPMSVDLSTLDIAHQRNPAAHGSSVYPCGSVCQCFIPFYCCIVFHCLRIAHFIYPFVGLWSCGLFPLSAARNDAVMNICVQFLLEHVFDSSGCFRFFWVSACGCKGWVRW